MPSPFTKICFLQDGVRIKGTIILEYIGLSEGSNLVSITKMIVRGDDFEIYHIFPEQIENIE